MTSLRHTNDSEELGWAKAKIERNFVDLLCDSGLKVRSPNTANQNLNSKHFTLSGSITENRNRNYEIAAQLTDPNLNYVSGATIEISPDDFSKIYRVIPKTLLYGMQIELPVFKKVYRPKSSKLTDSLAAFSQFLDAQRQGASHRYDDAEKSLQRAIQFDPQFATALWALAELRA